jgi:hypothetical protein
MKFLVAAVAAFFLSTLGAVAGPIDTITITGAWNSGTKDPNGVFLAKGADLGGIAYTTVYSFDPATLVLQTAGCSTNCTYKFASITETLTAMGSTQTLTANNSGTVQVCSAANGCGSIRFQLSNVNNNGLIISDLHDFSNGAQFFTSTNLSSNPTFLSVTNINGSLQDIGSFNGINITGFKTVSINAVTTAVPEPLTLSVFGAGIAGAFAARRRKAKKA